MTADLPPGKAMVNLVYRPDDFEPGFLTSATTAFEVYAAAANRANLAFQAIPIGDLVPGCSDRPHLWYGEEDLLQTRQCWQIDDFSLDPQTAHHLKAVARTIRDSDSILLNRSVGAPEHLVVDKLSIIQHAAGLGVQVPATVAVPASRYSRRILPLVAREIGEGPYIVKPREMGMGFAVVKVDTFEQLPAVLDMVAQTDAGYLVQPWLPNTGDVRVYIDQEHVVAAQHRRAGPSGYLANTSQGGSVATGSVRLDEFSEDCLRIGRSLGASVLAIDWLITPHGRVLSEWSAGFGGFADLPEPDRSRVAEMVFTWVHVQLKGG
jgi:ribosomal protein S6--L-glutamate ligase